MWKKITTTDLSSTLNKKLPYVQAQINALASSHPTDVFRLSLIVTPTHNNNNSAVVSCTAGWPVLLSTIASLK